MRHIHVHLHSPTQDSGVWEESKHPRKDDGKFGSGSSGGKAVGRPQIPEGAEALHSVMEKTNEAWGSHGLKSVSPELLAKITTYLHGKSAVGLNKFFDQFDADGLSPGLAKRLLAARKEHFEAQMGSKAPTRAERVNSFLKQKHVGPIKR